MGMAKGTVFATELGRERETGRLLDQRERRNYAVPSFTFLALPSKRNAIKGNDAGAIIHL
jgi:hypothetical protein